MLKRKPCYYRKLESLEDRENAGYSEYNKSREDEDTEQLMRNSIFTHVKLRDNLIFTYQYGTFTVIIGEGQALDLQVL